MYKVFVRNWWKLNKDWPNGLEPDPGAREYTIRRNIRTEQEAREIAQEYNRTHNPGALSRKAEIDEQSIIEDARGRAGSGYYSDDPRCDSCGTKVFGWNDLDENYLCYLCGTEAAYAD